MDIKQPQKKTKGVQIESFWRYLASKEAKIDQNRPKFMDDPKIFRKKFFGSKVSKWSNSKSYHVKSEIWRPSKKFLLAGHPGLTLIKFF